MIIGVVNAYREATIGLIVQDANGGGHDIDAVIDTGFTGFLTLPTALIAVLGLTWRGYASAVLGDGSLQQFDIYAATVIWDGQARVVERDAADTDPLVGMGLFYGHEVRIQARDGGTVIIEGLP
jgi:predicted aspartyl protease